MKFLLHSGYGNAGGQQSIHQISAGLTELGEDAYMIYSQAGHDRVVPLWNQIYGVKNFLHREELEDEPDQVHLLPANWGPNWYPCDKDIYSCVKARGIDPYKSKKVLFWLGVIPWQDWECMGDDRPVNLDHPNLPKMYHACQSQYAYDFLVNSSKIDPRTVFMLRDYTHEIYLQSDYDLFVNLHKRNNIILYNGAKGLIHSYKIIEKYEEMNCIVIKLENFSREEIRQLALKSKVYIDFGHHPGRDRIPREMAACGCIVISGDEGTASSDVDVPIGKRKFSSINGSYDYKAIREQVSQDINNYMAGFLDEDQVKYRMIIRKEKEVVYNDISNMLHVLSQNIL